MNEIEIRTIFTCKTGSPIKNCLSVGAQVEGGHDLPEADLGISGRFLHMRARPNGTTRIVKHLGSHGTQKEPTEWAIAVGRHDNQVDLLIVGIINNVLGRIALFDHALDRYPFEPITEKPI